MRGMLGGVVASFVAEDVHFLLVEKEAEPFADFVDVGLGAGEFAFEDVVDLGEGGRGGTRGVDWVVLE